MTTTQLNLYQAVCFNHFPHNRILLQPIYYQLGFSPTPYIYGQRIVLEKLISVLSLLPKKYGLIIWDVYRPRAVQKKLFDWTYKQIKKQHPLLSDNAALTETKKYMSPSSTIGDTYCPPHLSGGAIDLTLFDMHTKQAIDMGTKFDDFTERAHRDYFDQLSTSTPNDLAIQHNRQLLRNIMEKTGFTSYEYEWWHYDFGNIFWEKATGQPAIFGPLFGDLEWPSQ